MKLTIPILRRKAWYILTKQVSKIHVCRTNVDTAARSEYDKDSMEIWVNVFQARLDHAVVHELLHKILDEILSPSLHYNVYEYFITSLEKPFFKGMTRAKRQAWHRAIKKRIVEVDIDV